VPCYDARVSADHLPAARLGGRTIPGLPRSLRDEQTVAMDDATEWGGGYQVLHRKTYDVVERLGEGGMGKVFKAFDPGMDRYVALKVLKLDVPEGERRRFRREAVIAANFSHPNLVRVLDVGRVPETGVEWMAMEWLRGNDLGPVVENRRRVAFKLLVDIFAQTCDALDYIHTRRIAHCDIKPDNIFITRDSYNRRLVIVKLIDFGIARNLEPPFELQQQISGDPRYMAPEQQVLNGPLDERADLYALGITFFEVLTHQHPFLEYFMGSHHDLLVAHRERPMPAPSAYLAGLPPELSAGLDRLVEWACAKDPRDRIPSAKAFKDELLRLEALARASAGAGSDVGTNDVGA
jgi:serine/threonine-protein kinase